MCYLSLIDIRKSISTNNIDKVDEKLSESQFGLRTGCGTVDAIFITRQIIEKAREKNIPVHFHFIDFKAAFDTIWRNAL